MFRTLCLALVALSGLLGAAAAQTYTLPEIGLQNSGPCPTLSIRDRSSRGMIALGCIDSATGGFDGSQMRVKASGALLRSLASKLGDLPFTPQDMGAVTDGTTAVDAAFARLMTVPGDVTIPPGVWRLSQSATWPKGRVYRFAMGAQIKPDVGVTITIKGSIDAAPSGQIFAGAGKVVGLRFNRPEWWGAVGDYQNTFDSQPAFQAAYESARLSFSPADPLNYTPGSRPIVEIGNGSYNFCSPWKVYPVLSQPIEIRGPGITNSGGILQTCASFAGYALLQIHGVQTGIDPTHDFFIHDFSVRNSVRNSGATAGIAFNPEGAGYWLNGPKKSRLEDILVYDFPIGYDAQNIVVSQFNRIAYTTANSSISNNTAIRIKATGSNGTANAGELDIIASRLVPCPLPNAPTSCTNTINVDIVSDSTATGLNGVAAIRFDNMTFYRANSGIRGRATNAGIINDIWVNGLSGTQFDGIGCSYLDFKATGPAAQINNIHSGHVYHTTTGTGCTAYNFVAESGGTARGIFVTGGWFIGMGGPVANFYGVQGLTFQGNQIVDPAESGPAPVVLSFTKLFSVSGNIINKSPGQTIPFGFSITSDSDYGTVGLNTVQGVRNAAVQNSSTSANVIVDKNVSAP